VDVLRVLALSTITLIACGRVDQVGSISAPYRGVECRSADQDGLITCHQAIDRAAYEAGSAEDWDAGLADAKLDWWSRQPGSESIRTWSVTYHDVDIPLHGPPGVELTCIVGDWGIAIDATKGEYLVEGTAGDQHPVPCSSARG
jgi:hypothetical protein